MREKAAGGNPESWGSRRRLGPTHPDTLRGSHKVEGYCVKRAEMVLAVQVKAFERKCQHQGLPFTHTLPAGELQHGRGRETGRQVAGRNQGHGGPTPSRLRIKVHPERIWTTSLDSGC